MTLNLTVEKQAYPGFTPRITVIGVGGAGTNAVDNMIELNLLGVEFIVANTDAQQLSQPDVEGEVSQRHHHRQHHQGAEERPPDAELLGGELRGL